EVIEQGLIVAPGVFERVGKDGHVLEPAAVVDYTSQVRNRSVLPREPGGVQPRRRERVAEQLEDEGVVSPQEGPYRLSGVVEIHAVTTVARDRGPEAKRVVRRGPGGDRRGVRPRRRLLDVPAVLPPGCPSGLDEPCTEVVVYLPGLDGGF